MRANVRICKKELGKSVNRNGYIFFLCKRIVGNDTCINRNTRKRTRSSKCLFFFSWRKWSCRLKIKARGTKTDGNIAWIIIKTCVVLDFRVLVILILSKYKCFENAILLMCLQRSIAARYLSTDLR